MEKIFAFWKFIKIHKIFPNMHLIVDLKFVKICFKKNKEKGKNFLFHSFWHFFCPFSPVTKRERNENAATFVYMVYRELIIKDRAQPASLQVNQFSSNRHQQRVIFASSAVLIHLSIINCFSYKLAHPLNQSLRGV